MIPSAVFACGNNNSETISCKKEVSSKQETKDCCNAAKKTNGKSHNSCGGKCGHSNCNMPIVQVAFFVSFTTEIDTKNLFYCLKKDEFFNLETVISSGFQSLWLIPKIS